VLAPKLKGLKEGSVALQTSSLKQTDIDNYNYDKPQRQIASIQGTRP